MIIGYSKSQQNEIKQVWLSILNSALTQQAYALAEFAANEGTKAYIRKFITRTKIKKV